MKKLKVIVGCECSGVVRDAFIAAGHDAFSCDLKPSETPGPHFQQDLLELLRMTRGQWDLGIFHPTCTFRNVASAWALKDPDFVRYPGIGYHQRVKPGTLTGAARRAARREADEFFDKLLNCDIPRICVENPIVMRSDLIPEPSQTIQPHWFGDDASKGTCLWLRNLPLLEPTEHVAPRMVDGRPRWANQTDSGQNKLSPSENRWVERSKTYPGIAKAMAQQWGTYNHQEIDLFTRYA